MFPHTDAQLMLDLHNQRADELRREAAAHRIARATSTGRHRRFGRAARRAQAVRAPSMP